MGNAGVLIVQALLKIVALLFGVLQLGGKVFLFAAIRQALEDGPALGLVLRVGARLEGPGLRLGDVVLKLLDFDQVFFEVIEAADGGGAGVKPLTVLGARLAKQPNPVA
ncbi:MAG: hypothetical protein WDO13_06220 [Verrucomicrobiota bacterium]